MDANANACTKIVANLPNIPKWLYKALIAKHCGIATILCPAHFTTAWFILGERPNQLGD